MTVTREQLRDMIVPDLYEQYGIHAIVPMEGKSIGQWTVERVLDKIDSLGFDIVPKAEILDGMVLIFKGKHRPTWHYNAALNDPDKTNIYHSHCGVEFRTMFAEGDHVFADELPYNFCENCLHALGGKRVDPEKQPLTTLQLEAIAGATEGWRPDLMREKK